MTIKLNGNNGREAHAALDVFLANLCGMLKRAKTIELTAETPTTRIEKSLVEPITECPPPVSMARVRISLDVEF
jgi:hypothetical protein